MRIRTLKPEWLDDERLSTCTDTARMLSVVLILLADDYGNGRGHSAYIASKAWAYSETPEKIREGLAKAREGLAELSRAGFLRLYTAKGQTYYTICNWAKHQRVDRPGKPRVPGPSEADENPRETPAKNRETLATDRDLDLDQDQEGTVGRAGVRDATPPPESVEGSPRPPATDTLGPSSAPSVSAPDPSVDPWVLRLATTIEDTPSLHRRIAAPERVAQLVYDRACKAGGGLEPRRPFGWYAAAAERFAADVLDTAEVAGQPLPDPEMIRRFVAWVSNPRDPDLWRQDDGATSEADHAKRKAEEAAAYRAKVKRWEQEAAPPPADLKAIIGGKGAA